MEYLKGKGYPEKNDQRVDMVSKSQTAEELSRELTAEPQRVDFAHPEFCTDCDPVTCIVEGSNFSGGNWRDVLVALTEDFLQSKPKAMELYHTSLYPNGEREYLLKEKPKFSARQLSNGYWINVNLWCEYRDARLPATLLSVIQRIVEYYFLQLCSYSIEDLRERVKTHIGGDDKMQRIADEILRFIYDEKFDAGDGINYAPDHDIPAYKEVFEMIFEALSQKSHYLKMSGVGE